MMTPKTQTIVAITVFALTTAVALAVLPMKPDGSATVLVGMGVFIIVWNVTKHLTKRKCDDWINSKTRHEILFAIILASLLLLGGISTTLAKELDLFNSDLTKRILGVNIGLMLIVLGNYMPKKLTGTDSCCTSISKSRSMQRFMGWTFVLAGIFYACIWIFVDLNRTSFLVLFAFPVSIAIMIGVRLLSMRLRTVKNQPEQSV